MTRILIVNPDPDTQNIFATALEHAGYRVSTIADPASVVDEAGDCALVITDFPVRGQSGFSITHMLRANPATALLPILNATTHALPAEIQVAHEAGVTLTIVLPADVHAIVDGVRRLLAAHASA